MSFVGYALRVLDVFCLLQRGGTNRCVGGDANANSNAAHHEQKAAYKTFCAISTIEFTG